MDPKMDLRGHTPDVALTASSIIHCGDDTTPKLPLDRHHLHDEQL